MEARSVLNNGLGVLSHLFVKKISGIPLVIVDGIKWTSTYATATALTNILVDNGLLVFVGNGIGATMLGTNLTATAFFHINRHLAGGMLFHLACTASTAHADILDCTAKACHFMALKMSQGNEYVSIHNGTANLGSLAVFTIFYRNFNIICTLKTVANNNLTTSGNSIKAVYVSTVHMLQGVLSAAWIKGIAVSKEWNTALLLYQISNCLGIVRAKESHVTKLAKMHFDSHELIFHVNIFKSSLDKKLFHFGQNTGANRNAKIGKINL